MFGFRKKPVANDLSPDIEARVLLVAVIATKTYVDNFDGDEESPELLQIAMDNAHDLIMQSVGSEKAARIGALTLGAILSDPAFARHIANQASVVLARKYVPANMQRDIKTHCKKVMNGMKR